MTAQNRATLYGYFQTGDKPSQSQFGNFIDSSLSLTDPAAQSVSSTVTFNSSIAFESSLSVMGNASFDAITVPTQSSGDKSTHAASTQFVATAITNAGVGTGTVSSVTFTGDGTVLSSTPSSAVTSTGTVAATLKTQNANIILAGPASGGALAPTFRALVNADLPNTAVTPASYTNANITVNQQGVITAASNGSSSSGLTLLSTVNASNQASVTFNSTFINGTYNKYVIEFDGVYSNNNIGLANLSLQISTNNGSTWVVSGYNGGANNGGGSFFIAGTVNNSATSTTAMQGAITFSNPSASKSINFFFEADGTNLSGTFLSQQSGINITTTPTNAIKIFDPNGNNFTGNFHLMAYAGT